MARSQPSEQYAQGMVESQAHSTQRETRKLRALRYDAGSMALNLVCTVGRRGGRPVERLRGCTDLAAWLVRHGLILPGAAIDDEFLGSIRQLREALHDFLRALAVGEAPAAEAVQLINETASVRVPATRITFEEGIAGTGVAARREGELGADHVLALIAQDGIGHLSDTEMRRRLSVCAAEDCQMLFLSATPGARRRWCSMSYCGNRLKAANHRARRQASPPDSPLSLEN